MVVAPYLLYIQFIYCYLTFSKKVNVNTNMFLLVFFKVVTHCQTYLYTAATSRQHTQGAVWTANAVNYNIV